MLRRWDVFQRPRFVLQVHGMRGRRRGGDGVLVDDLLMAIAIEQHAERIKTGNYSPQLDAVTQEDRDRRSLALQVLEERVLKTMNLMSMLRPPTAHSNCGGLGRTHLHVILIKLRNLIEECRAKVTNPRSEDSAGIKKATCCG